MKPRVPFFPSSFSSQRRTFLRVAGTSAAGLLVGCGRDVVAHLDSPDAGGEPPVDPLPAAKEQAVLRPEDTTLSEAFPLALASGDVTESSAVVGTRYAGGLALQCIVWEMDGQRYARLASSAACVVEDGGFVHVDVQGL